MKKKVKILGQRYDVLIKAYDDDPYFKKQHADGYCDYVCKKIVVCDGNTRPKHETEPKEYWDVEIRRTLRHEIVHAFMAESGLAESSGKYDCGWAMNEEMVDWIAQQHHKLHKVYKELGVHKL